MSWDGFIIEQVVMYVKDRAVILWIRLVLLSENRIEESDAANGEKRHKLSVL